MTIVFRFNGHCDQFLGIMTKFQIWENVKTDLKYDQLTGVILAGVLFEDATSGKYMLNSMPVKCRIGLRIHFQTSRAVPLKFGNR